MTATGVRAQARIVARADGRGGTALPVLDGEGPLALRRTRAGGDEARVMVVGAMSGPLGGDRFSLDARVEEGARLHVGSAAATIALPGQAKGEAHYDVRLDVADGGELRWLPEQLISAGGSDLNVTTRAELAAGARLVLREEQVLGRVGEEPGRLTSRLTVRVAGRTVLDQELSCGPGAPGGWDGPAVLAGHRSVGQFGRRTAGVHQAAGCGADAGGVRRAGSARGTRRTRQRRGPRRARAAAAAGRGADPVGLKWPMSRSAGRDRPFIGLVKKRLRPLFSDGSQPRGSPPDHL